MIGPPGRGSGCFLAAPVRDIPGRLAGGTISASRPRPSHDCRQASFALRFLPPTGPLWEFSPLFTTTGCQLRRARNATGHPFCSIGRTRMHPSPATSPAMRAHTWDLAKRWRVRNSPHFDCTPPHPASPSRTVAHHRRTRLHLPAPWLITAAHRFTFPHFRRTPPHPAAPRFTFPHRGYTPLHPASPSRTFAAPRRAPLHLPSPKVHTCVPFLPRPNPP